MEGVFISSFEKKLAGSGKGLVAAAKEYSVSVSKTRREAVYVNAKPSPNKISSEIYQVFEKDAERMEMIISNEKWKASGGKEENVPLENRMVRSLSFEYDDSHMSVSDTKSPPVSAYRDFIHMHSPTPSHVFMEDPVISTSVLLGTSSAKPSLTFPSMVSSPLVPSSSSISSSQPTMSKRSRVLIRKGTQHSSGAGFMTILKVSLSMVVFLCCLFGPLLVFNDLRRQLSGNNLTTPSSSSSSSSSRRVSIDDRTHHRHHVLDNNGTTDSSNTLSGSSSNSNNDRQDSLVAISEETTKNSFNEGPFSRILSRIRTHTRHMERLQQVHHILTSPRIIEKFEISGQKGALSTSIPYQGFSFLTGSSVGGKAVGGSGVADWCW